MSSAPEDILLRWKTKTTREDDIPYSLAIRSLFSDEPLVEARQGPSGEWNMCRVGKEELAVFAFAFAYSEGDDIYVGNMLPPEEEPDDDTSTKIRRYAGPACQYLHAFDTSTDKEFWALQTELEMYMRGVDGFNPSGLPRADYQSGEDATRRYKYYMRVPIFIRLSSGERKPMADPRLHPRIIAAHRKSRTYRANPVRPEVHVVVKGRLVQISDCIPNNLIEGDIVAIRFTITYTVESNSWQPYYTPLNLIRVSHGAVKARVVPKRFNIELLQQVSSLQSGALIDEEEVEDGAVPVPEIEQPAAATVQTGSTEDDPNGRAPLDGDDMELDELLDFEDPLPGDDFFHVDVPPLVDVPPHVDDPPPVDSSAVVSQGSGESTELIGDDTASLVSTQRTRSPTPEPDGENEHEESIRRGIGRKQKRVRLQREPTLIDGGSRGKTRSTVEGRGKRGSKESK